MPKASKQSATRGGEHGAVVDREEGLGGYTVNFVEFRQDIDASALLKGLPDDRCQCPHWGYVLKGRIKMKTTSGDEFYEAGEAFYWPPGHSPSAVEDTEYVDFSPSEDFAAVIRHIMGGAG